MPSLMKIMMAVKKDIGLYISIGVSKSALANRQFKVRSTSSLIA
jgi:hypothetical protein